MNQQDNNSKVKTPNSQADQGANHSAPSHNSQQHTGITPNYREDAEGTVQNKANVPNEFLHLFEHDPSEVILEQALRHPFGVYVIYTVVAVVVALVMAIAGAVLVDPQDYLGMEISQGVAAIIGLVTLFIAVGSILGGIMAVYVYKKSRMILTNQKVVLIQYHSLFSREVSQLNIGEVEDVNVAQPTVINRITKSGTITIETAGEQNNYQLTWMKDPYTFAKHTIQAHEGSIAEYGN